MATCQREKFSCRELPAFFDSGDCRLSVARAKPLRRPRNSPLHGAACWHTPP